MKKRILSLLLTLVMILGMIPATSLTAFAATTSVGRINAVGAGYEYNSTLGAYTPVFSTLEAYDTGGNKINISNFVDASRYAFYTSTSLTAANKLTTEPQYGETYYFCVAVDLYVDDVSYDYDKNSIINNSTVSLQGFKVEYDGLMEREMGSYLQIVYKATKLFPFYVGGVCMNDGDYLAVGATKTQTTQPSGGYAYYKDGILTLNNYSYEGEGYIYYNRGYRSACIYTEGHLTVNLLGTNTLKNTYTHPTDEHIASSIAAPSISGWYEPSITISGTGSLTCIDTYSSLFAEGDIVINGGTIHSDSFWCINTNYGDIIINGGSITAKGSSMGLHASNGSVVINGGTVTATGSYYSINYEDSFTVADGLYIYASTNADGTLGEYVAENHDSYKKIVVRDSVIAVEIYVGGVGMSDGDYLAVGATATQTTKPSGGYAYYKDGKLTLNNYSYEGKGYQYISIGYCAIVYAKQDLTVELVGTNSLVQERKDSDVIRIESEDDGGCITIDGTGSLSATTTVGYAGIYVDGTITVNGGTIVSAGKGSAMRSKNQDIIINGGNVTVSGQLGLNATNGNVKINGGNVLATGTKQAVNCATNFTVAEGMKIQASTTEDGALGEYVASKHSNYKKISVKPAPTHTVTFKVDTTTVATKTVEDGKTVTAPADPTQSGKTFLGWYTDGGTKFDFTTPITGDITLTAKFEDATSNVKLGDVNGDDTIDYADIQCIYQHMSTDSKLTGDALIAADVNKDGAVDYGDIQRLYQHLSTDNKLS